MRWQGYSMGKDGFEAVERVRVQSDIFRTPQLMGCKQRQKAGPSKAR